MITHEIIASGVKMRPDLSPVKRVGAVPPS